MMLEILQCLFPYSVFECVWLAPCALILDLVLGDPALPWPHPVIGVGKVLATMEQPARRWMGNNAANLAWRGRVAGCVALLCLLAISGICVRLVLFVPYLSVLLAIYLAWAGLAMGCLLQTGQSVLTQIEEGSEEEGRQALSCLVSRETQEMHRPLMRKTLADTLSENFTDALVAPFFWLLVAGPVGLWLYKAVSTADSMWGYLTPRWCWLGWAAARGDDLLAFLPARLSICALWWTDFVTRHCCLAQRHWQGFWPGFKSVAKQARGMPSPNSGWSMTACAWLCGARQAGPAIYFGVLANKPWLGPPERLSGTWHKQTLQTLLHLLRLAGVLGMLSMWLIAFLLIF